MIISFKHNFIFFAKQKTATTSIYDFFIESGWVNETDIFLMRQEMGRHMLPCQCKQNFTSLFQNYRSFEAFNRIGIMREPVDWFLSYYNSHSKEVFKNYVTYTGNISINEYIDRVKDNINNLSASAAVAGQTNFFNLSDKTNLGVNQLARFEYIIEDLNFLDFGNQSLNKSLKKYLLRNRKNTSPQKITKQDLDSKTLQKIENLYEKDIQLYEQLPICNELQNPQSQVTTEFQTAKLKEFLKNNHPGYYGETCLNQAMGIGSRSLEQAISLTKEAETMLPDTPEIQFYLGKLLTQKGDLEAAERVQRRTIELSPKYSPAYFQLSVILNRQGRINEAIEFAETAVDLNSNRLAFRKHLEKLLNRRAQISVIITNFKKISGKIINLKIWLMRLLKESSRTINEIEENIKKIRNKQPKSEIGNKNVKSEMGNKNAKSKFVDTEFFDELKHRWNQLPTLSNPVSQLCTASQFNEPYYSDLCSKLKVRPRFHRKQWEFIYILRCLELSGMAAPHKHGLAFGVGREKLPSYLVSQGCHITATDLPANQGDGHWVGGKQHTDTLENLFYEQLVDRVTFYNNAEFRPVNMNAIPRDLSGFDFCWSTCALEHLGSLEAGLEFIRNSLKCLRPGGVAVHTTEFNLGDADYTLDRKGTCVYREKDITAFIKEMNKAGHRAELNLNPGQELLDTYVDRDRDSDIHIRLYVAHEILATSMGIMIQKAA
jgi:tetratricopeptide (TPR) repeat protein